MTQNDAPLCSDVLRCAGFLYQDGSIPSGQASVSPLKIAFSRIAGESLGRNS